MGQSSSKTKFHHHGHRGRWLKYSDIFDIRLALHPEEAMFQEYYASYCRECEKRIRDSLSFAPNEDFQSCLESRGQDPHTCLAQFQHVTQKYLHDVLAFVVDRIDGMGGDGNAEPDVAVPEVGQAFVKNGFFFFFWSHRYGDKFGRLEARNVAHILELQLLGLHVPFTYHIRYKGKAVTIQALIPISSKTVLPNNKGEILAFSREIATSFNLAPYDETGFSPPQTEYHGGLDGRYYSIVNYQWTPPFPCAVKYRLNSIHRFTGFRLDALAKTPEPVISARVFRPEAVITESTVAIKMVQKLIENVIHEVPAALPMVTLPSGDRSIFQEFRKKGLNECLLGLLLMSLLRNVSPPVWAVYAVEEEIISRGMKEYVLLKMNQGNLIGPEDGGGGGARGAGGAASAPFPRKGKAGGSDTEAEGKIIGGSKGTTGLDFESEGGLAPSRDRDQAQLLRHHSELGGAFGLDDQTSFTVEMNTVNTASASTFIDVVSEVLHAMMEYEGAPVPKEATLLDPAVLPPTDLFGGEVLPVVYKKFFLRPDDVDLYQAMPHRMRMNIFKRTCEMLGLVVEDNQIVRVYPFVKIAIPTTVMPRWMSTRLGFLTKNLLRDEHCLKATWQKCGVAFIALSKFDKHLWDEYHAIHSEISIFHPPYLSVHLQQCDGDLRSMQKAITWRKKHAPENRFDRVILLRLLRLVAKALMEDIQNAVPYEDDGIGGVKAEMLCCCEEMIELGISLLNEMGSPFAEQFRVAVVEATREVDRGKQPARPQEHQQQQHKPAVPSLGSYRFGEVTASRASISFAHTAEDSAEGSTAADDDPFAFLQKKKKLSVGSTEELNSKKNLKPAKKKLSFFDTKSQGKGRFSDAESYRNYSLGEDPEQQQQGTKNISAANFKTMEEAVRLLSRHCEPDSLLGQDFLQLAVAYQRSKSNGCCSNNINEDAAAAAPSDGTCTKEDFDFVMANLSRAKRILCSTNSETSARVLRCTGNMAVMEYLNGGKNSTERALKELLALKDLPECPLDVLDSVLYLLEMRNNDSEKKLVEEVRERMKEKQEEEETEPPFLYIPN